MRKSISNNKKGNKIFLKTLISVLIVLFFTLLSAQNAQAQCCVWDAECPDGYTCTADDPNCDTNWTCEPAGGDGGFNINFDALENATVPAFAGENIGYVTIRVLRRIYPIAGLILLLYLLYGGFVFLTSGGSQEKTQKAKVILSNALVGFVIIFSSYWVMQIIGTILGLWQIESIFGAP